MFLLSFLVHYAKSSCQSLFLSTVQILGTYKKRGLFFATIYLCLVIKNPMSLLFFLSIYKFNCFRSITVRLKIRDVLNINLNNMSCHFERSHLWRCEKSSVYGRLCLIQDHGSTEFILSEAEGLTMTNNTAIRNCIPNSTN